MALEKMVMTAYTDSAFSTQAADRPFSVLINPEKYSRAIEICYTDIKGAGSAGGSPVFSKVPSETIGFELVFDGTGVVPLPLPGPVRDVDAQIKAFKAIVLKYDRNMHSPRFVKLAWGSLLFKGRMKSLELTYTMFQADGTPLRARAQVGFTGFTDEADLQRAASNQSADLTHHLTVEAGDTLPLLCHRIYGDSGLYAAVAAANGLTGFRDLQPGQRLVFPPLTQ